MFVSSGKKVSAGSSVLSDMVQRNQERRECFSACMTDQGDFEHRSVGKENSGDEADSASVKKMRTEVRARLLFFFFSEHCCGCVSGGIVLMMSPPSF